MMSRHAVGMCRRIARRAAPADVTFPMSNYPYSTPSLPGRQTLADMVMFYGSAELRSGIRADRTEDEDPRVTDAGRCRASLAPTVGQRALAGPASDARANPGRRLGRVLSC